MINKIKKTAIILSIAFGFMLMANAGVAAQKRYYRVEGDPRTYRTNPTKSGDYKKGANGYDNDFGNKQLYRQNYRAAYLKGYKDGYRRYTDKTFLKNKTVRKAAKRRRP